MAEIFIPYFLIGMAIAALMALGAAKMQTTLELLGRPVSDLFPKLSTLFVVVMIWPVVIVMAVLGKRQAKAAPEQPTNG